MGVHGLTTYLRENQRSVSTRLNLPSSSSDPVAIVVDGWSFIYDLYRNSGLPWVYGGEYHEFYDLVAVVVNAWIKVGLKVYFVFDGPTPELKFPTVVSRLGQSHVHPSLLFFRTSTASRGTGRFLNETRIIPPLAYTACIIALQNLQNSTGVVELHFADEEGDPYAVELAGRVGGYVVGNDSDFVVLNSDGYLGYIPLEEMMWYAPSTLEVPAHEEDSGFQEVRRSKSKKRPAVDTNIVGRGVIPPDGESPTLSLTIYKPELLAAHLKIPVTLLPLLGALVGNDFTLQPEMNRRNVQSMFFDRQLSLSQRITRVALTIQTILSPNTQKRRNPKHQVGSVMDLIDRAVNALLSRLNATLGSGEIESIVEKIVEATLQYAIPKYDADNESALDLESPRVCALHPRDSCPAMPLFSRRLEAQALGNADEGNDAIPHLLKAREQYLEAYRNGHLAPKILDILSSGTFWPRLFLENPDSETVSRSIGRPLREWTYSVLDNAVGLEEDLGDPERSEDEKHETEPDEDDNEDLDELIDVVESDSDAESDDLLAPLKGELHRLHQSNEYLKGADAPSSRLHKRPVVTEYLRRGTRVAQEGVEVTSLGTLISHISLPPCPESIPLVLLSFEEKFTVFLRALDSDVPPVRSLPKNQIVPVLSVRWVVHTLHLRWNETQSKEREKERWTRREAACFLAVFVPSLPSAFDSEELPAAVSDRSVQLTAQVLQSFESIEHFLQSLLLTNAFAPSAHLFSGRTFHKLLTEHKAPNVENLSPYLMSAVTSGLEHAFAEDRSQRVKKTKGAQKNVVVPKTSSVRGGGIFDLLANVAG
ncbi:hypothetical protein H0H93_006787 [Arthromyces matolae]|nr:hypothetical protein H0H93_006787 [Arthromyces matolae]